MIADSTPAQRLVLLDRTSFRFKVAPPLDDAPPWPSHAACPTEKLYQRHQPQY